MSVSVLPLAASLPAMPVDAAVVLALAAGVLLLAGDGRAEAPPPAEVTAAAILAAHGHV